MTCLITVDYWNVANQLQTNVENSLIILLSLRFPLLFYLCKQNVEQLLFDVCEIIEKCDKWWFSSCQISIRVKLIFIKKYHYQVSHHFTALIDWPLKHGSFNLYCSQTLGKSWDSAYVWKVKRRDHEKCFLSMIGFTNLLFSWRSWARMMKIGIQVHYNNRCWENENGKD